MNHKALAAGALAVALVTPLAMAGDHTHVTRTPQQKDVAMAAPLMPLTLSSIFATVAEAKWEIRKDGTFVADGPMVHVWVARIDADGNMDMHCVNDPLVARSIMERKQHQAPTPAPAEEK